MQQPMMLESESAIFLNGSYGVGKTTVLDHVGDRLATQQRPFSLMDVDWFHRSWPPAPTDPENHEVEARNMADVWRRYRANGPRLLVVSGVIRNDADLRRYEEALEVNVRPVLLEAEPAVLAQRLQQRYSASQDEHLSWHLDRCLALQELLASSAPRDLRLDAGGMEPNEVARQILEFFDTTA